MAEQNRLAIVGSEKMPLQIGENLGRVPADEIVSATVVVRRRGDNPRIATDPGSYLPHIREEYGVIHGADPKDLDAVEEFAQEHHLTVAERDASRRIIRVTGTAEAMQEAFQTELNTHRIEAATYRTRSGALSVPASVHPAIIAVLGLDQRPAARPHFRRAKASTAAPNAAASFPAGSFSPVTLAQLYDFPAQLNGSGQTVAIVELGGGYRTSDLRTYFSSMNVKMPKVSAVSVDGAINKPGGDADGEVMLDIEVVGATAPGAAIAVYFAPNTDQGFHDAISKAVHDDVRKPSIISISWGLAEDQWTDQARNAINAALQDAAAMGVTVTVAAGDDGSTDRVNDG